MTASSDFCRGGDEFTNGRLALLQIAYGAGLGFGKDLPGKFEEAGVIGLQGIGGEGLEGGFEVAAEGFKFLDALSKGFAFGFATGGFVCEAAVEFTIFLMKGLQAGLGGVSFGKEALRFRCVSARFRLQANEGVLRGTVAGCRQEPSEEAARQQSSERTKNERNRVHRDCRVGGRCLFSQVSDDSPANSSSGAGRALV